MQQMQMQYDPEASAEAKRLGRQWLYSELSRTALLGSLFGWGVWMIGTSPLRAAGAGAIIGLCIISGVGPYRFPQACLGMFAIGLLIWCHIPIVDEAMAFALAMFHRY